MTVNSKIIELYYFLVDNTTVSDGMAPIKNVIYVV